MAPREPLIGSGVSCWNWSRSESFGSSLVKPAVKLLAGALELEVTAPLEDADETAVGAAAIEEGPETAEVELLVGAPKA